MAMLPLANRLVNYCVVHGVDEKCLLKATRGSKIVAKIQEWVGKSSVSDKFPIEPQLLGVVSPMVAHFPCEKEPLGKSPPIDISQGFNEKQIGVPSDRVYALQHLIMPDGVSLYREEQNPTVVSARLTDDYGSQNYCTSLTIYRKLAIASPDETCDVAVFAPTSIVLVSHTPRYRTQKELLSCLLRRIKDKSNDSFYKILVEFCLHIFAVPCPPPGDLLISFKVFEHVWKLKPPRLHSHSRDSSALDIRLHYPFHCLSPENVLKVVAAILTEKRIIFTSQHYSLLTYVIECFFLYIFPMEWRHPTITIVARSLLDFLDYFGVYLYGVHSSVADSEQAANVSDVVWVKLDEGDVTFNLTDSICPALPESASKRFLINYKKLQEEYKRIDILMTEIPSILDEDAAERKEELEADYDSCLSSAFLDLIVESVGEMFIFQTRNGNKDIKNWPGLSKATKEEQYFYTEVAKADTWSNLIYQRMQTTKRDDFVIRVESIANALQSSDELPNATSTQKKTTQQVATKSNLGKLFDIGRKTLTLHLNETNESTDEEQHSRQLKPLMATQSSVLSSSSILSASSLGSFSFDSEVRVLELPSYSYNKKQYFEMVVQQLEELKTTAQRSTYAACLFLQACYLGSLRKFSDALELFSQTDKHKVGLTPPKYLILQILKEMSEEERKEFQSKRYCQDFQKLVSDQTPLPPTPVSEPHTEPISLERFKPLLKKKEIAKDPDLVLKVFNVLANKHTHIQPQLFHEFCENWQNHEAKRRQFVPPNFPLAKKTKTECKESILLIYDRSPRTSLGQGTLVLTTFRLLVVSRGNTHELLDLKKNANLGMFDLYTTLNFQNYPAINEKSDGTDAEGKQGARRARGEGWYASFEKKHAITRNFWYIMMTELMKAHQHSLNRKSPEIMTLAETSVLITNALINLQQYCQDHADAEKRIQRVITKLQTYANKDTSISTQQVEGLLYRLNPSIDETEKRTIECTLYFPPGEDGGQGKLWVGLGNGLIKVYNLDTKSTESCVKVTTSYHRKAARLSCLLLVEDSVWVADLHKTIHILNAESCCVTSRLSHMEDSIRDLVMDKKNNLVWGLLLEKCCVIALDPDTREPQEKIDVDNCLQCKCLAVNGSQLWIGTNSGIFIFDSQTRCLLQQVRLDLDIKSLAVSETNEVWCSVMKGESPLIVFDSNTFKEKHQSEMSFRVNVILSVGKTIWCGKKREKSSAKISIYDAKTYQETAVLDAHSDSIRTMVFTNEIGMVISGSASKDGTAAVWDSKLF